MSLVKVLITGATGFVGRKLIPRILEEGHEVVALVRSTSNIEGLPKQVEVREADLLDITSLEAAVQDIDAVIHLAAYFDFYPSSVDLMYRVNVEGTKNLMSACVGTKVERFIYCSSTEAIGPVRFPPGNEDTELNPSFDYGHSKVLAEQAVREITKDTNLDHVILRPTGIMGEGDLYTAFEAIEAVNDGAIPVLPGDGNKRLMYTHVDDVVEGFIKALTSKSALNDTFILSPDAGLTYNELFEYVGECCGVKPPTRKIPTKIAKIGIGLLSPLKNRRKTTFLWHMKTVQSMDEDRLYDNCKAKRILGWKPMVTMKDGLKRAIDWYFENGFLKKRS
ncbi:NAD-dependent epimerase/dehydratase family protein [Candidatus Thorarchaeota archaeon]|nr:MAG: NAD-dependent epimerase/dehydratase family protein [Candidatus Thorarchaeota archaeon]